jgi:hypothetical protein
MVDPDATRYWITNVAIMLALAAPPYLVRLAVYDDPFGTAYFHALSHYRPPSLARIHALPAQVLESFWLFTRFLRGWLLVRPAPADYVPFVLLSLAPFCMLWRWVRSSQRVRCTGPQLIGLAVIALTIGAFILKNVIDFSPEGRYLFMAVGPIAWLIASGIRAFARQIGDRQLMLLRLVPIYMLVYSIVAAFRYLLPAPDILRTFSF